MKPIEKLTEDEKREFKGIVDDCADGQFNSINVASAKRTRILVKIWHILNEEPDA